MNNLEEIKLKQEEAPQVAKVETKEEIKEEVKEETKEETKMETEKETKEENKEENKEKTNEEIKEEIKEETKVVPQEALKETKETPKSCSQKPKSPANPSLAHPASPSSTRPSKPLSKPSSRNYSASTASWKQRHAKPAWAGKAEMRQKTAYDHVQPGRAKAKQRKLEKLEGRKEMAMSQERVERYAREGRLRKKQSESPVKTPKFKTEV